MFDDKETYFFPMESVKEQVSTGGFIEGGALLKGGNEEQFRSYFERFKEEYRDYDKDQRDMLMECNYWNEFKQ